MARAACSLGDPCDEGDSGLCVKPHQPAAGGVAVEAVEDGDAADAGDDGA